MSFSDAKFHGIFTGSEPVHFGIGSRGTWRLVIGNSEEHKGRVLSKAQRSCLQLHLGSGSYFLSHFSHLSSGNNVLINNVLINNALLRNLVRSVQACILGFRNGAVFSLLLLFLIVARGSTSSLPLHAVFSREREWNDAIPKHAAPHPSSF